MGRSTSNALQTRSLDGAGTGEAADVSRNGELSAPALAWDGDSFLVVASHRGMSGGEPRLVGTRLGRDGSMLDGPAERSLFVLGEEGSDFAVVASSPAGRTLVAYRVGAEVRARIVSRGDGIQDDADNCPARGNPDQADADGDGIGDACEDVDSDTVGDSTDTCPTIADSTNADADGDGLGDACDPEAGPTTAPGAPNEESPGAAPGEDAAGCSITRFATDGAPTFPATGMLLTLSAGVLLLRRRTCAA